MDKKNSAQVKISEGIFRLARQKNKIKIYPDMLRKNAKNFLTKSLISQ